MVPPVTLPLLLLSLCRWAPPSGPAHLSVTPPPLLPHKRAARLSPASVASALLSARTPSHECATPTGPPLLLLHLAARQARPPTLFLPERRRAAIKRCRPTPSLVRPFSSRKHRCTAPPPPLPSHRCPVHPRQPRGVGPRQFPPELRRRPPSSVSVARSFDPSQPTAPQLIGLLLQAVGARPDCRRPPCQLHRHRMSLTEHNSATPPSRQLLGVPSPPSCCPTGSP
jgi:hypothetical protein